MMKFSEYKSTVAATAGVRSHLLLLQTCFFLCKDLMVFASHLKTRTAIMTYIHIEYNEAEGRACFFSLRSIHGMIHMFGTLLRDLRDDLEIRSLDNSVVFTHKLVGSFPCVYIHW